MPVTPLSSPSAAIVQAVVARIALRLGISTDLVRPVLSDNYPVTLSEPLFAYVRIYGPRPFVDAGAGRLFRPFKRFLRVYVYSRTGSDTYGGDEAATFGSDATKDVDSPPTNPPWTAGQLLYEEVVYDALDDFAPLSGTVVPPTMLTIEPIHTTEDNDAPERDAEDDKGLIRSALDFECNYCCAINASEPPPAVVTPFLS